MEEVNKSIWDKKADELTVGDQYKIAVGVSVAVTAASLAIWGIAVGAAVAWDRHQAKKAEDKRNQERN